jgi:hypothetical protein
MRTRWSRRSGAPALISLNVVQPAMRLRTMMGVHRSVKISAARAIG